MKHVFLIHSNTVLLSALGAINCEKIANTEVIFLYCRNFKTSIVERIESFDVSAIYAKHEEISYRYNPIKHRILINEIDSFINNNINDEFLAYVPHLSIPFFTQIATHPLCKGSNLLQEGAFSFFGKKVKVIKFWIKNLLFSNNRMWWTSSWDIPAKKRKLVRLKKTYAITSQFFESIDYADNILIKWPQIEDKRLCYPEGSAFFLFEAAIEQGLISLSDYLFGCRRLLTDSGIKSCILKFHPNQKKYNKDKIIKLFIDNEVSYDIFDDTIPFELVLCSSNKLNLYGFSTSLLKFGVDLGHNVVNYTGLLCEKSKRFREHINQGSY